MIGPLLLAICRRVQGRQGRMCLPAGVPVDKSGACGGKYPGTVRPSHTWLPGLPADLVRAVRGGYLFPGSELSWDSLPFPGLP